MKHYNIPIFISHFGCPNACVFCNQKKINGRETDVTMEDLRKIIDEYLKIFQRIPRKKWLFWWNFYRNFFGNAKGISRRCI